MPCRSAMIILQPTPALVISLYPPISVTLQTVLPFAPTPRRLRRGYHFSALEFRVNRLTPFTRYGIIEGTRGTSPRDRTLSWSTRKTKMSTSTQITDCVESIRLPAAWGKETAFDLLQISAGAAKQLGVEIACEHSFRSSRDNCDSAWYEVYEDGSLWIINNRRMRFGATTGILLRSRFCPVCGFPATWCGTNPKPMIPKPWNWREWTMPFCSSFTMVMKRPAGKS